MIKMELQLFGGRGASQTKPSKVGGFKVKKVTLNDGGTIELGSPLIYGGKDPALSGDIRSKIEDWEAKRRKNKIEYATILDENGNVVSESRGGKGSVKTSLSARMTENSVFSHNHPREEGDVLSGTFSDADLRNFARFNQTTYRATGKEGTYSISKSSNFDAEGFTKFVNKTESQHMSTYRSKHKELTSDYVNGKITYSETVSKQRKLFNEYLVNSHNSLLENQKTYGYTYTLEK